MFLNCKDCGGESARLMCWPHVHRNLEPKYKHLRALDKNIASKLQKSIEDLQWASETREHFLFATKLLKDKYMEIVTDCRLTQALEEFFNYLSSTWIDSSESSWFEGAHPYGASNNQVYYHYLC